MSIRAFWELVEGPTKLASILPFCVGTLFAAVVSGQVNWVNSTLFFIAMLLFDMTTTAINNWMDYRKAKDDQYRQTVNVIGRRQLPIALVRAVIWGMLAVSTALSLVLVWRTDWLLLLAGGACFVVGIFYTFGPLPLSRMPLGELFSGVVMGLGIPGIAAYVTARTTPFLQLTFAWPNLALAGDWPALVALAFVCVTPMATIANVMLANNMSDLAEDTANKRMTLPMYLGPANSRLLYTLLAYGGYAAVALAVAVGLLPWPTLVALVTLPWAMRNTNRFRHRQDKRLTFKTSLYNLLLENGGLIAGLLLSLLVKGGVR
ncbi:UbiA family prenyltransferase [Lacticaseibacillus mingshuiensis]|uniref:UbiA family prenyltransferase n=1 Tax=Lacticaseibacillus mingshuiensis TaxID=2799574 RepID=UPI00195131C5|nr:UbiA family prenyltransferase [Lacticaseibacillus mingshuiensis]